MSSSEHTPTVHHVTTEPAGVLRNKQRVVAYGANNKKLFWTQPYKSKQQAAGVRTLLSQLIPDA